MRVLMAGGGTGGHLFPGLALAAAIRRLRPEAEIRFVGTRAGLDQELVPRAGYALDLIAAGRGSPLSWRRPLNLPRFVIAIAQSLALIRRWRPQVLVALGGFAAAAPGLAARFTRVPLMILEQNAVPGRVNRLLGRWARQIHLQFAEAAVYFENSPAEVLPSGSPLRDEFVKLAGAGPVSGPALLIMGGSQGAQRLNQLVTAALPQVAAEVECEVIHIAGAAHEQNVRAEYDRLNIAATVHGFTDNMAACLQRSRLAISRAGAGSLAELAAAGLPALLLPLPSAKDDHQRKNAQAVAGQGGAVVLEEGMTPETLASCVIELWRNDARRGELAAGIRRTARPRSGEEIARAVIALADSGATGT